MPWLLEADMLKFDVVWPNCLAAAGEQTVLHPVLLHCDAGGFDRATLCRRSGYPDLTSRWREAPRSTNRILEPRRTITAVTLQAIIIRADGALAETEEVRRQAFAQVFSEAGFEWSCDREGFALTAKLGSAETRIAHYVRSFLRGKPETEDLSLLIRAMHRRASKIFGEMLTSTSIEPRPGVSDLIIAARGDGLRLVLVTLLERDDTERLLSAVLGQRGRELFDLIIAGGADGDGERLYEARSALGFDPRHSLVIEAGRRGAAAAKGRRLPRYHDAERVLPGKPGIQRRLGRH